MAIRIVKDQSKKFVDGVLKMEGGVEFACSAMPVRVFHQIQKRNTNDKRIRDLYQIDTDIIKYGVRSFSGFIDEDNNPIPCTPETVVLVAEGMPAEERPKLVDFILALRPTVGDKEEKTDPQH